MMPQVSFITTVRNGEGFISSLIYSVIEQTIDDWEFIIVDDGSSDDTIEIIESHILKENRIKLIKTKGIGRGKALNLAINNSKSDYIANIDVDDPCHKKRAEIQLYYFKKYPTYSALSTDSIFLVENEDPTWENYETSCECELKDITITSKSPFKKTAINHSSVMFRKDDLINVGMYDETRNNQFDYELWIRLSIKGYRIGNLPLKLSSKRIHSKQSFERKKRRVYLKEALKLNLYVIKEFNLPYKYNIYVIVKYIYGYLPQIIRRKIRKKV